ncbi:MAG: T9SS type A sorting domain-containing protein [Bacteroidetes bacterium]|nr:T9SS type A sorting domain-containing protein [Bacteroidota bacterium]
MKKTVFVFVLLLAAVCADAKKVKFSVDMSSWQLTANGVHITGDFQDEAGLGSDWDPATAAMTQDAADTNIYTLVVDLPAFRAYEYKFVNGIFGYEQEFVPLQSRVNYNFIDSRWIYLDSLDNDTLDIGAIRFSGNAPAGKQLVRFYVDMQNETSVSTAGVHLAGWFQNWSASATRMYSFDGNVYEYLTYVDSNNTTAVYEYKFLNGNTPPDYESLQSWCASANNYRYISVNSDTMLNTVCFSSCGACTTVGMNEVAAAKVNVYPNPAHDILNMNMPEGVNVCTVQLTDAAGRMVYELQNATAAQMQLNVQQFDAGLYVLRIADAATAQVWQQRVIIN